LGLGVGGARLSVTGSKQTIGKLLIPFKHAA
jgi:hypothetical protein